MKFDLRETARDHKIIVAHRGACSGNIPCNTMPAYETALKQGADMIETDLNITSDGKLIIFHPIMERRHLGKDVYVDKLTWEEVQQLRYQNYDRTPTQFGIITFDELLETYVEVFGGARNAMFRMKENWSFLRHRFEGSDRLWKDLRKTTDLIEYRHITAQILSTLPLVTEFDPEW